MPDIEEILFKNERLIHKIANYFPYYSDRDDLIQAGCQGMIQAYEKFNPNRGVKFTTYAYEYILGAMREVVRKDKSVKVSKELTRLNNKIEKARELLAQRLMRMPTDKELSEYLEISENDLAEIMNANIITKSIDSTVGDTTIMLHEIIESPSANIDDLLFLKTELENLQEPERTIMIKRYYDDMTQSEVASELGLSQVYVSRKEKKVLTKIRDRLTFSHN